VNESDAVIALIQEPRPEEVEAAPAATDAAAPADGAAAPAAEGEKKE
jgi:hypothetical protein